MGCTVPIKYTGIALPLGSNTYELFNLEPVYNAIAHDVKRVLFDFINSHTITVNGYWKETPEASDWEQFFSQSLTAPGAGSTNPLDITVEGKRIIRFDLVNGGTNQTEFNVNMALSFDSGR